MKTLETKITGETCVKKIQVMRSAYVSERFEKCRNCNSYEYCPDYSAVRNYEIPLNNFRFT